jgi:hypothetical protein
MTTTRRIATGVVATLALATAAPASATPWDPNSRDPSIPIRSAPGRAMIAPASTNAGNGPVVLRLTTERSGFDWADAGIGAAGATALTLLGVGGALMISDRRPHQTHHSAVRPN